MNVSALIIDITLWGSVLILGFMAWQRGRVVLVSSVREGSMDFINIVPRIALGVIGSGYIAAVIPPEVITGWLGPDSGWFGVLTAVDRGCGNPGGPVVGFSIGAVALKVGGGPPQVIAYVVAWALFAFQRMILWEIPFMPARFVWFRAAVSVPFPFLAAAIAMRSGSRERAAQGMTGTYIPEFVCRSLPSQKDLAARNPGSHPPRYECMKAVTAAFVAVFVLWVVHVNRNGSR